MGGKALKFANTRRYIKDEYLAIADDVSRQFNILFPQCTNTVIPSFFNKQDFGDLDILITSDNLPGNYIELIKTTFNPMEILNNGDVLSFDYKNFQIDLIKHPEKIFNIAKTYYSYNDLGNLIGKVAYKLGLKYGHAGLAILLRDGTNHFGTIELSTNPEIIFNFLGFDYNRFLEGFNDLNDIYDYVVKSRYFNPDIYLLENNNHRSRVRDKKRTSYIGFLEYISGLDVNSDKIYKYKPKKEYLHNTLDYFGSDITNQYNSEWVKLENQKQAKVKFNGTLVSEITGLTDNHLGEFIQLFKQQQEKMFDGDFIKYVLDTEQTKINQDIENLNNFFKPKTTIKMKKS